MVSGEDEKPTVKKDGRKRAIFGWIVSLTLLALLGSFIGVQLAENVSKSIKVPSDIAQTFNSPMYLPQKLPGNYEIDRDSFVLQETVLIFQGKDSADGTIVFTEQPKPADINFEDFYAQQFKNAETLDNVPFPSVAGKSNTNNGSILSIVTEETWIIVSSKSPISIDDLEIIAKSIKRYQE